MIARIGVFAILVFIATAAHAYIPPYWMILSRTSDNHGKGTYVIDQDVIFNSGDKALIVNERWIVQSENSMRLEVTGRRQLQDRVRLTYVYQNNRRFYVDENGVKKSEKIPDTFTEPYFHFRLSKNIKPVLVAQQIAPGASLKSEAHRYSPKHPHADPEPYVRLARVGGVITYAIGTPTPPTATSVNPGLWIDQDQFVVRKLRLPSQVEIIASQYQSYGNGLWLPKERSMSWPGYAAKITVNSVASAPATSKLKSSLESESLNFGENPNLSRVLPEETAIQDFYQRLR